MVGRYNENGMGAGVEQLYISLGLQHALLSAIQQTLSVIAWFWYIISHRNLIGAKKILHSKLKSLG